MVTCGIFCAHLTFRIASCMNKATLLWARRHSLYPTPTFCARISTTLVRYLCAKETLTCLRIWFVNFICDVNVHPSNMCASFC